MSSSSSSEQDCILTNSQWTEDIALITGAAGAIGEATVYSLAEAGVRAIFCADLDGEGALRVATRSKDLSTNPLYKAEVLKVDVADPEDVKKMVDFTLESFGRIDINVNAVGIDTDVYQAIYNSSIEEFDRTMSVNARGVMLCNRAITKAMISQQPRLLKTRNSSREIGRGVIVNLGSAVSHVSQPGKTAYVTSKHAVMGITKTAAIDCAAQGIRVNAVCPSWVRTPAIEAECASNVALETAIKTMVPNGRLAELDEVVGAISFLCSSSASYISGIGLVIDAGLTLTVRTS